jgi:hypothetical protein
LTGKSSEWIRKLCDRGDLVCERTIDGERLIDLDSVERYMARRDGRTV